MNRELLTVLLVDEVDEGTPMCRGHADRLTAPTGWAVTDDRTPPEPEPETLVVTSPLLSRAFHGGEVPGERPSDDRPPRRLAWFEQVDRPADDEAEPLTPL